MKQRAGVNTCMQVEGIIFIKGVRKKYFTFPPGLHLTAISRKRLPANVSQQYTSTDNEHRFPVGDKKNAEMIRNK